MTSASTVRALTREAKVQQRIKQRVAEWWHRTQCPNCRAKLELHATLNAPVPAFPPPKQTAH